MTIQKRSIVMATILVMGSILYGIAEYYSPFLILHVVEQTLIQKASPASDPVLLRQRLHSLLATIPDQNERTVMLLRISKQMEKVQSLKPEDINRLLAIERN